MRHRNNVISIRASDVEYNVIKNLAGDAKETMTDYIIKCAMQKKINVIDVKPLITEVKRIGGNINRLTLLANMGKINSVYLQEMSVRNFKTYMPSFKKFARGVLKWQSWLH